MDCPGMRGAMSPGSTGSVMAVMAVHAAVMSRQVRLAAASDQVIMDKLCQLHVNHLFSVQVNNSPSPSSWEVGGHSRPLCLTSGMPAEVNGDLHHSCDTPT